MVVSWPGGTQQSSERRVFFVGWRWLAPDNGLLSRFSGTVRAEEEVGAVVDLGSAVVGLPVDTSLRGAAFVEKMRTRRAIKSKPTRIPSIASYQLGNRTDGGPACVRIRFGIRDGESRRRGPMTAEPWLGEYGRDSVWPESQRRRCTALPCRSYMLPSSVSRRSNTDDGYGRGAARDPSVELVDFTAYHPASSISRLARRVRSTLTVVACALWRRAAPSRATRDFQEM